MDIKRLRTLAGFSSLTESHQMEEDVREHTNELLRMMDDGEIEPKAVAEMALRFMSDDDVAQMMDNEEIGDRFRDDWEYEEEDDGDDLENDYFDDLDAGDTEMDRRSDQRRGW